jgi:hypothetical protein
MLNNYQVTYSRILRFTCNSAVAQNITFQNLLDTILFTTTATVPFDLFFMVRIRRIRLWGIAALGTPESLYVLFDGTSAGFQGDRKMHTDTSMGIEPAYVDCRPASKSLASMFQISSAQNAFNIDCPAGTVIDVHLDFKGDTLGNATQAQNVSVAANVGVIAYRGLDGLAVATTKFSVPTGIYSV